MLVLDSVLVIDSSDQIFEADAYIPVKVSCEEKEVSSYVLFGQSNEATVEMRLGSKYEYVPVGVTLVFFQNTKVKPFDTTYPVVDGAPLFKLTPPDVFNPREMLPVASFDAEIAADWLDDRIVITLKQDIAPTQAVRFGKITFLFEDISLVGFIIGDLTLGQQWIFDSHRREIENKRNNPNKPAFSHRIRSALVSAWRRLRRVGCTD